MAGTGAVQGARIADAQRLNDDVIDRALIRRWLASGFLWLLLFPTVGVILSTKFTYPEFLGSHPWLTFGRLRPIHVNCVIWGAFSTLFIGLCHYIGPRLCGVRLWNERWSHGLLWVWNLNLAVAVILLAAGFNRGWEAGEFALGNVIVIFLAVVLLTVQFLMTIKRRRERPLYVSLWYLIAAFIWTDVNLVLLILGPYNIPGINNAAWHGLFIHYVVGLWITPAGYVLIYYFLPASVRNPIYSHKLSLIGFWSLAFFYPFVGIHHYLYSPLADWGFWLVTLGIGAMGLVLSAQGLQQGFMLMAQSEFLDTVTAIRPYWWVRTFTGISMDLGISLVVSTLMQGSLARRSA